MKLFLPRIELGGWFFFFSLDSEQGWVAKKQNWGGLKGGRKKKQTLLKVSPCSKNIFGWIKY